MSQSSYPQPDRRRGVRGDGITWPLRDLGRNAFNFGEHLVQPPLEQHSIVSAEFVPAVSGQPNPDGDGGTRWVGTRKAGGHQGVARPIRG